MSELESMRQKIAAEKEADLMEAVDIVCRVEGCSKDFVLTTISRLSEKLGYSFEESLKKRFGVDVVERRKNKKMEALKESHRTSLPGDFATPAFSVGGEHGEDVKVAAEKGKRLKESFAKYGQIPFEERQKYVGDPNERSEDE